MTLHEYLEAQRINGGPLVAERVAYGAAGAIPLVDEATFGGVFENAIRSYGVVAACEWFGHAFDSEFTLETIRVLQWRANVRPNARLCARDIQNGLR